MKKKQIFISGLALGIVASVAITIPVVLDRENRLKNDERAVGALIVSGMHCRAFTTFLMKTNQPSEEKLTQLVLEGLKVYKKTYEDLRAEGILGPVNKFKFEYDQICETLKKLEGIQQ